MKKNKGFFFIETAMLLLFIFGILLLTINSYNLCLKNMVRLNQLFQAYNLCENALIEEGNSDSSSTFSTRKIIHKHDDFSIVEVQVVSDEKIVFNLVQIQ